MKHAVVQELHNDISTNIQVWFLRHGKPIPTFDYETRKYDEFMQMLCNGHRTPLAQNPGINFKSLPKQVDFIGYSPIIRAKETARILQSRFDVRPQSMKEMELLSEVKFDDDIIQEHEFISLVENRKDILERWYDGRNKAETFGDSLNRVKEIESFLSKQQEKTIILITHGWFLRLLDIYFVQGKHERTDITLEDILKVKPVPLGHSIQATVARKKNTQSQMEDYTSRITWACSQTVGWYPNLLEVGGKQKTGVWRKWVLGQFHVLNTPLKPIFGGEKISTEMAK